MLPKEERFVVKLPSLAWRTAQRHPTKPQHHFTAPLLLSSLYFSDSILHFSESSLRSTDSDLYLTDSLCFTFTRSLPSMLLHSINPPLNLYCKH